MKSLDRHVEGAARAHQTLLADIEGLTGHRPNTVAAAGLVGRARAHPHRP